MPYADNLYSADDSDVESFSDELSPTDGYFTGPSPSNAMVPDPSLEQTSSAESKAQEARAEAESNPENHSSPTPLQTQSTFPPLNHFQPSAPAPYSRYPAATAASSNSSTSPTTPVPPFRRVPDTQPRHNFYSEDSPLLRPFAPPPTYSAATSASQSSHPSESFGRNYNTISEGDLGHGQIQTRMPESIGGPVDSNERQPLWTRHPHPGSRVSRAGRWLVALLALGLALIVLVTPLMSGSSGKSREKAPGIPGSTPLNPTKPPAYTSPPFKMPESESGAYCSAATLKRSHDAWSFEFDKTPFVNIAQTSTNFDGETDSDYYRVHTAGEVQVRRIPVGHDTTGAGYITVDMWVSDRRLLPTINGDWQTNTVNVSTPRAVSFEPQQNEGHCISVEAIVWLPEKVDLQSVDMSTETLDIHVFDDVRTYSQDTILNTVSGNVTFPTVLGASSIFGQEDLKARNIHIEDDSPVAESESLIPPISNSVNEPKVQDPFVNLPATDDKYAAFSSRKIVVHTISGHIQGSYPLYDTLILSSTSGSIDVAITPFEASSSDPKPAISDIHTVSGSIKVSYPIHPLRESSKWPYANPTKFFELPPRDYRTSVVSTSGSIQGHYIIGSFASFRSMSGSLDLELLPLEGLQGEQVLETKTLSSSTEVRVMSPYKPRQATTIPFASIDNNDPYLEHSPSKAAPLRSLVYTHRGKSGHVHVRMPSEWEGVMRAQSTSGSLKLHGYEVVPGSEHGRHGVFGDKTAMKGRDAEHGSTVDVETLSGSVEVEVLEPFQG